MGIATSCFNHPSQELSVQDRVALKTSENNLAAARIEAEGRRAAAELTASPDTVKLIQIGKLQEQFTKHAGVASTYGSGAGWSQSAVKEAQVGMKSTLAVLETHAPQVAETLRSDRQVQRLMNLNA